MWAGAGSDCVFVIVTGVAGAAIGQLVRGWLPLRSRRRVAPCSAWARTARNREGPRAGGRGGRGRGPGDGDGWPAAGTRPAACWPAAALRATDQRATAERVPDLTAVFVIVTGVAARRSGNWYAAGCRCVPRWRVAPCSAWARTAREPRGPRAGGRGGRGRGPGDGDGWPVQRAGHAGRGGRPAGPLTGFSAAGPAPPDTASTSAMPTLKARIAAGFRRGATRCQVTDADAGQG